MSSTTERKLAAIMFTDIAGYTEQMSEDEDKAFALIQKKRKLLFPLIKKYEGRLIKEIGDGTLTRYFRVDNAIKCATDFQSRVDMDLNVRAGIHTGEVILDKEDVFGDVVNVASRLESIALPGSILVSKETIDRLDMSDKVDLVSLGMQSLKGVGRLIEVYAIKNENLVVPSPDDYTENKIDVHSDDEMPSIAIISFENKGKEEDVFYSYGISIDLISDVTSLGSIRVASKKQVDDFKNLSQDKFAKVLNVRYIVNGELWRIDNTFQLSIELYDSKDKKVVWSDRWQEKWENLPAIKANLSDGLIKALDSKSNSIRKIETINTLAYEFYLKAIYKYEKRQNVEDIDIAIKFFEKAIKLDGNLLAAKNYYGNIFLDMCEYDKAISIFKDNLNMAEVNNDSDMVAASLYSIGNSFACLNNHDEAIKYFLDSLEIRKKNKDQRGVGISLFNLGNSYLSKNKFKKAIDCYEKSLLIFKEIDDKYLIGYCLNSIGIYYLMRGDYDMALTHYKEAFIISEELKNKDRIGDSYNNIGNAYYYKKEYEKALKYFNNALDIYKDIDYKLGNIQCYNNIANVYADIFDFDKALEHYKQSLLICEKADLKYEKSILLNNMGNIFCKTGEYQKALNFNLEAHNLQNEAKDFYGLSKSLFNIGVIYLAKENFEKASDSFRSSISKQDTLLDKDVPFYFKTKFYLNVVNIKSGLNFETFHEMLEKKEYIDYEMYFYLYKYSEKKQLLKKAFNSIEEITFNLVQDCKHQFLNYPIPKKIVNQYSVLFKD